MDERKLQALLEDMTLSEKIEQLVQLHGGFFGTVDKITGPAADFRMTEAALPHRQRAGGAWRGPLEGLAEPDDGQAAPSHSRTVHGGRDSRL